MMLAIAMVMVTAKVVVRTGRMVRVRSMVGFGVVVVVVVGREWILRGNRMGQGQASSFL